MRKVAGGLFISLDGVVEAPNEWQFDNFDDDMMQHMSTALAEQDAVLLGRVTYQEWAGYWPTSTDEPFASYINGTPKHVVSTTLDSLGWNNSHLVSGSLADAIARLKRAPGKTIGVAGSPTLLRSLVHEGLLDELTLMVHPVVVGKGKRLFDDRGELQRMRLVASKTTSTGVVIATYEPLRG